MNTIKQYLDSDTSSVVKEYITPSKKEIIVNNNRVMSELNYICVSIYCFLRVNKFNSNSHYMDVHYPEDILIQPKLMRHDRAYNLLYNILDKMNM